MDNIDELDDLFDSKESEFSLEDLKEDTEELEEPQVNEVISNIESFKTKKNLEIRNKHGIFSQTFYLGEINDNRTYTKFIKNIEKHIRTSQAYKAYIGYLKGEIGLENCAVLGNINAESATIEMHHYPFNLYDICDIVIMDKMLDNSVTPYVNTFNIADEVLKLHFANKIGVVPLSKTVHELVHQGEIFISYDQVFGNVNDFVTQYKRGISDHLISVYNDLLKKSADPNKPSFDVLNSKPKKWNVHEDMVNEDDLS